MRLTVLFEGVVKSTDEALEVLGLSRGYTADELKKSYRRAALKNHPDRGGSDDAMSRINSAYELLSKRVGNPEYSDVIRDTDTELRKSGTFKGGRGNFETRKDIDDWILQNKGLYFYRQVMRDRERRGGTAETGGERLNRLADDTGFIPSMRLVMRLLNIADGEYDYVRPHYIKLHNPMDPKEMFRKLQSEYTEPDSLVWSGGVWNILVILPKHPYDKYNSRRFNVNYSPSDNKLYVTVSGDDVDETIRSFINNSLV